MSSKLKESLQKIFDDVTTPKAFAIYAGVTAVASVGYAIFATYNHCKRERATELNPLLQNIKEELKKENKKKDIRDGLILGGMTAMSLLCIRKSYIESEKLIDIAELGTKLYEGKYLKMKDIAGGAALANACGNVPKSSDDILTNRSNDNEVWFYDEFADTYYRMTRERQMGVQYYINRLFAERGTVTAYEYYDALGIADDISPEKLAMLDHYGWDVDTYYENGDLPWIGFYHKHPTENNPDDVTIISFEHDPSFNLNL